MCTEIKIELTEDIEKIISENLDEKEEHHKITIKSCEDCWNYDKPYITGGTLHCCSYDYNNRETQTARSIKELYDNCPINHEMEVSKSYIKKYGIIHRKPSTTGSYYNRRGSISIVDFSGTRFEWDGYNPDVDWEPIAVFYYETQEEADKIMEMALEYYREFNLDSEFVEKHCYG